MLNVFHVHDDNLEQRIHHFVKIFNNTYTCKYMPNFALLNYMPAIDL